MNNSGMKLVHKLANKQLYIAYLEEQLKFANAKITDLEIEKHNLEYALKREWFGDNENNQ